MIWGPFPEWGCVAVEFEASKVWLNIPAFKKSFSPVIYIDIDIDIDIDIVHISYISYMLLLQEAK